MLNYEYARLVEQDRRREIAERIRIERALHPEPPASDARNSSNAPPRSGIHTTRSATTPAR